MKIETWDLKTGDIIEVYSGLVRKEKSMRAKLTSDPYENHGSLLVDCIMFSIINYSTTRDRTAIFSEQKSCWYLL